MARRRQSKQKLISLPMQQLKIKETYSNIENCTVRRNKLQCVLRIKPSEHSQTYRVQVLYELKKRPKALLLSPPLKEVNGKRPHHLHEKDNFGYPSLCVYFDEFDVAGCTDFLADTFIPWISTWLHAYEYWIITGEWHYPEYLSPASESSVNDGVEGCKDEI